MNNDLQRSIDDLRTRAAAYERPERYYDGRHDLKFATEKFANTFGSLFREFALNLCPIVCDAVRDKLRITSFGVMSSGVAELGKQELSQASSDSRNSVTSVNSATHQIWHRNLMAVRAGEVHKEVLRSGDAYVIVWPDETGRAAIYPHRAASISVTYDAERPGHIIRAAKYWLDAEKRIRLNLFYPDRIERYISKANTEGTLPDASGFQGVGTPASVPALGNTGPAGMPAFRHVVPNPYGIVPVFHFANNADVGSFGRSELEAAIPVQDGLNKSVLDMLVAMEFSAFRQRWAVGIEVDYDQEGKTVEPFKSGVEKLWVAGNADARFGDFDAAELEQFLKVKDSFRVDIASVTGTPLHYFLQQTGDHTSGESLRRSETRFLAKVRDRQAAFGQVWADAMSFALRIEGIPGTQLITQWEDPSPMSERERLENLVLKTQLGLPLEKALVEAGYGIGEVTDSDSV